MSILNPTPQEIEDDIWPKADAMARVLQAQVQKQMDDDAKRAVVVEAFAIMDKALESREVPVRKKKFIVSGTYAEYSAWIQKKGFDKHEYIYVGGEHTLIGHENIEGFYIGTYYNREDLEDIRQRINLSKRSIVTGTIGVTGSSGWVQSDIRIEIRKNLHNAITDLILPQKTTELILDVIDKELDKY